GALEHQLTAAADRQRDGGLGTRLVEAAHGGPDRFDGRGIDVDRARIDLALGARLGGLTHGVGLSTSRARTSTSRGANAHGHAAEDRGAAERVDLTLVGEVVDAHAGVLGARRDAEAHARTAVAE